MAVMYVVAVLLVIQMILMNGDKLYEMYAWVYKKIKKPKFKEGEFVMINDVEYEVICLSKSQKPYTYFCLPIYDYKKNMAFENYYHESEIKKKTGLLKELE